MFRILQQECIGATRMKTKLNTLSEQDTFSFCASNYVEVCITKYPYRITADAFDIWEAWQLASV